MKKLLCIDGNSILNRSFYGIRLLTNRDGFPTNALYGLVNVLTKQLETISPDYAAIAYDLKAPTFRHKMYDAYKAGRHAMPEELALQMPASREVAEALGLHVLSMEGYEADDILGTLSHMAATSDEACMAYLLTGDRDALQLIGPRVHVLLAGNTETADMDKAAFMAKYGVASGQFVDVKALMGDASDNIPGVPGIGEKTAIKLISEHGSLDGVYAALDAGASVGTPSVVKKLTEGREKAYLSRTLAAIKTDVPLGLGLEDLAYRSMDRVAARDLFLKYNFTAFIKRFGLAEEKTSVSVGESSAVDTDDRSVETAGTAETAETAGTAQPTDTADTAPTVATPPTSQPEVVDSDALTSLPDGRYAVDLQADRLVLCRDGVVYVCASPTNEALRDFLAQDDRSFVCHDAKSLYKTLASRGIHFRGVAFDVMLAAYVLNAGMGGYDPDRLCVAYLGQLPEAGEMAWYIDALYAPLAAKLEETQQSRIFFDIEMPLAAVLCDMELCGFKIDREATRDYGDTLDTVAADLEGRIFAFAGRPFNISSPKQLGEILFDVLQLPTGKKTKTGYSTNAEVLDKLKKYHPIVEDILEYRQVTKLKSTYVDGLLKVADDDGLVHTTFKQTGTVTGRLSSIEPNLQNIPIRTELGRQLRKFFIPSAPGRVLIDADYSQIELRLLAHVAGDTAMIAAFKNGFDIHTDTAARVFGVRPEEVSIELRKKAKAINFGIMYGMGEHSLSEDLHIPHYEAKSYIDSYMHSYPQIDQYLKDIVAVAYEQGYVTTALGRRRYIPELSESNKMRKKFGERVAMNSPIQGTAADIIKIAMIRVADRLAHSGLDARMILQVHDELILEASEADAPAALSLLVREMEHAVSLSVPLDVEAHIGQTWYEAH